MKKKLGSGTLIALLIYALLLAALTAVESGCADSGIRSFSDALWYSLVTITTVGYGDLYPVSAVGKLIGVFFLLLSVGFLAFLISAAYSMITGQFWPGLMMRMKQNRPWFLFSGRNEASLTLASRLHEAYPDSLVVFCNTADGENGHGMPRDCVCLGEDIHDALKRSSARTGTRSVFLISEDELQNCDDALALQAQQAKLYCRSAEVSGMPDVSFFDPCDSCARLFWQMHPLRKQETVVLIVGSGRYARAMINSAMVTNCRTPMLTTQYHLFEDWSGYMRAHYRIGQAMAIGREADGKDALFFHENAWNADAELIARADRIIFCLDDEDENVRCAQLLQRCYAHGAAVYVRTSRRKVPGIGFGAADSLYTPELVMKQQLDQLAAKMHERYRSNAGRPVPAWEELDAFTRNSNRAAADHIPTKIRLLLDTDDALQPDSCRRASEIWQGAGEELLERCRRNEHDRWMRFHSLYNWQYAPVRSNAARQHPSLLPYEQLNAQERAKDDYAWQLLADCADIQE